MATELERRTLGRTGIEACVLSLGCAWFGSDKSSDAETIEGVRRAIELGIDFIDTSPGYGESERRVGLALADGWRDKVTLETKIGTHRDHRGDYSAATTRWSVENSLRQLQTEYLDSVLIHDPGDIEAPLAPGACLDTLLQLKDEGKIGHIGLGVRQHAFHRRMIETGQCEIILTYLDYTLLNQSVAQTTLPLARERGVGIIMASVFGMGLLGGREPDLRSQKPRPQAYLAHAMWQWCRDKGVNIQHLAMQFCLHADFDGLVMPGPHSRRQVEEAYAAATTEVDPEVWRAFGAEFGVGLTG